MMLSLIEWLLDDGKRKIQAQCVSLISIIQSVVVGPTHLDASSRLSRKETDSANIFGSFHRCSDITTSWGDTL